METKQTNPSDELYPTEKSSESQDVSSSDYQDPNQKSFRLRKDKNTESNYENQQKTTSAALHYKCNICNKTYKTLSQFQVHLSQFHNSSFFQCAKCKSQFPQWKDLKYHLKIAHGYNKNHIQELYELLYPQYQRQNKKQRNQSYDNRKESGQGKLSTDNNESPSFQSVLECEMSSQLQDEQLLMDNLNSKDDAILSQKKEKMSENAQENVEIQAQKGEINNQKKKVKQKRNKKKIFNQEDKLLSPNQLRKLNNQILEQDDNLKSIIQGEERQIYHQQQILDQQDREKNLISNSDIFQFLNEYEEINKKRFYQQSFQGVSSLISYSNINKEINKSECI